MTKKAQVVMLPTNEKHHLKWWEFLSDEDKINLEKIYGYYGHDIGLTEDDIYYIFQKEIVINNNICSTCGLIGAHKCGGTITEVMNKKLIDQEFEDVAKEYTNPLGKELMKLFGGNAFKIKPYLEDAFKAGAEWQKQISYNKNR